MRDEIWLPVKIRLRATPWDPTRYLKGESARFRYLKVALEEHDPKLIAAVKDDIARSRKMHHNRKKH